MTNALTTKTNGFDLGPQTFEQAVEFSKMLANSDLVPKDYKNKPGNCLIAMQWGAEIGLKPLQSLQNLAVINGRPALWGDAVLALVRSSPLCEYVIETDDGETATCRVKRKGEAEQIRTFSNADAKAAGLLNKQGPWTQYRKRMRQMRARGFAVRDVFPDLLRGVAVAEEVLDTPTESDPQPAQVIRPDTPLHYPDADFGKNVDIWAKAVAADKITLEALLAKVQTKGELTAEQLSTLHVRISKFLPDNEPDVQDVEAKPVVTYAQVADAINKAESADALNEAADLIGAVADARQREELTGIFESRQAALEGVEA